MTIGYATVCLIFVISVALHLYIFGAARRMRYISQISWFSRFGESEESVQQFRRRHACYWIGICTISAMTNVLSDIRVTKGAVSVELIAALAVFVLLLANFLWFAYWRNSMLRTNRWVPRQFRMSDRYRQAALGQSSNPYALSSYLLACQSSRRQRRQH